METTASLEQATSRISAIIRDVDLATPVEHLNRWKIRDVVAHLGGVHRWATRIVNTRSMAGPGITKSKLDGPALCDWFGEGAAALVSELGVHDPSDPCPNFNPGSDRTIGWWIRRQTHESTVHRWDIEKVLGQTTAIPASLAVDGVDEFLDVFVRTRGKQTLTSTLLLQTTHPKQGWTLTPATKPGRIDVAAGSPDTTPVSLTQVIGKPEALLLALWGRQSAAEAKLTIAGDVAAAASLLDI